MITHKINCAFMVENSMEVDARLQEIKKLSPSIKGVRGDNWAHFWIRSPVSETVLKQVLTKTQGWFAIGEACHLSSNKDTLLRTIKSGYKGRIGEQVSKMRLQYASTAWDESSVEDLVELAFHDYYKEIERLTVGGVEYSFLHCDMPLVEMERLGVIEPKNLSRVTLFRGRLTLTASTDIIIRFSTDLNEILHAGGGNGVKTSWYDFVTDVPGQDGHKGQLDYFFDRWVVGKLIPQVPTKESVSIKY